METTHTITDPRKAKSNGRYGRRGLPQEIKDAMIADYLRLKSTRKVGALWGRSYQSINELLNTAGLKITRRTCVDAVVYDGRKYTPGKAGYLRDTLHGRKQAEREKMLHRHIWTQHHGPIPKGHDVIFLDGDIRNCDLANLRCLPRPEATRLKSQDGRENGHTKAKHAQRVKDYEPLVIKEVMRYQRFYREVALDDLLQQGRLGVIDASKKHDGRATPFGCFARIYIKSRMKRWIDSHRSDVRVPSHLSKTVHLTMASMDAPLGADDDSRTLADLLPVDEQTTTEADKADRYALIQRVMKGLKKRERTILLLRFWEDKTLEETGEAVGVTRERVRQIEFSLLKRFRRSINMRRAA